MVNELSDEYKAGYVEGYNVRVSEEKKVTLRDVGNFILGTILVCGLAIAVILAVRFALSVGI